MFERKKKKPTGLKPWFHNRRRKISEKCLRRGPWNFDDWKIYFERRNEQRDQPRRPKRMALRLEWAAELDAEVRRHKPQR